MKLQFKNVSWLLVITTSMFLFTSCADHKDEEMFKRMSKSFENSFQIAQKNTSILISELRDKLNDPSTVDKAGIWYPKVVYLQYISENIISSIEHIKDSLNKQRIVSFSDRNNEIILKRIIDSLKKYRIDLFNSDSLVNHEFKNRLDFFNITKKSNDNDPIKKEGFVKTTSGVELICYLSMLENNIAINENIVITYCLSQIPRIIIDDYGAYVIVSQSSTIVQPKQDIQIDAGVGAFNRAVLSEVFANDINVKIDSDGGAHYTFKAPSKPGKYTLPIKISYLDQDGKKETIEKVIEYKVVKEISKE
jgi:hypothetical protein